MQYISTRGQTEPIGFQDAVMTGLATDGGLLLPVDLPDVRAHLEEWAHLPYQELAFEVIRLFAEDIPAEDLRNLIERSYASFRHPEVAPSVTAGTVYILELFHGPTLAFKDVALQLLGHLFAYILEKRGGQLNILAATSGDTGSAAIHGMRGQPNISLFIMHPAGRTSPIQERQMTSVLDGNVFNLAVEGTFDDCQHIMKSIFADVPFKREHALGTVNSVNWARVLAQMVYYFYAAPRVMHATGAPAVRFAVPTGNFGDIFAGYLAQRMGLPIDQLILATNENDILARFFNSGVYDIAEVVPTISPSMDIQAASNFERYLFYRLDQDAKRLVRLMAALKQTGSIAVGLDANRVIDPLFAAGSGDTAGTLETIKRYHEQFDYVLDPHTAVGVQVAERIPTDLPTICLATAQPAKFAQTVKTAIGKEIHHPILDALVDAETRCEPIANDINAVKTYLATQVRLLSTTFKHG